MAPHQSETVPLRHCQDKMGPGNMNANWIRARRHFICPSNCYSQNPSNCPQNFWRCYNNTSANEGEFPRSASNKRDEYENSNHVIIAQTFAHGLQLEAEFVAATNLWLCYDAIFTTYYYLANWDKKLKGVIVILINPSKSLCILKLTWWITATGWSI